MEEEMLVHFQRFRQCTRIYCDQWSRGVSLDALTVPEKAHCP